MTAVSAVLIAALAVQPSVPPLLVAASEIRVAYETPVVAQTTPPKLGRKHLFWIVPVAALGMYILSEAFDSDSHDGVTIGAPPVELPPTNCSKPDECDGRPPKAHGHGRRR